MANSIYEMETDFGYLKIDPSRSEMEVTKSSWSPMDSTTYAFQIRGMKVEIKEMERIQIGGPFANPKLGEEPRFHLIANGTVQESAVADLYFSDKLGGKHCLEDMNARTQWKDAEGLFKYFILHATAQPPRTSFHNFVAREIERISMGIEAIHHELRDIGVVIKDGKDGFDFNFRDADDVRIKEYLRVKLPEKGWSENEWRRPAECLKELKRWTSPREILKGKFDDVKKITKVQLKTCFDHFEQKASNLHVDLINEAAFEFYYFLSSLDEALNAFAQNLHPRLKGQPGKYSTISLSRLEEAFQDYWKSPDWQCQYLDRLFLTSFIGCEAEAYILTVAPASALGAIFASNKKEKRHLLERLLGLVGYAEAQPCSLQFLRSKILEATSEGCFVHAGAISLVDRALSQGIISLD